jgi:hypothetical protein
MCETVHINARVIFGLLKLNVQRFSMQAFARTQIVSIGQSLNTSVSVIQTYLRDKNNVLVCRARSRANINDY